MTPDELAARKADFRARMPKRFGRDVSEEEAGEMRTAWVRYLRLVAPVLSGRRS